MKKNSVKEYYKDFEIVSMNWSDRVIQIAWRLPSRSISSETCLYRHCDGSWHLDADSKQYGLPFAKVLSEKMAQYFLCGMYPAAEEDGSHYPSDISKMEYLIRNEEMYRKALKKAKKVQIPENEEYHHISAWYADDAV